MKPLSETKAISEPGRYLRALAVVAAPVRNMYGDGPPDGAPLDVWGRWSTLEGAIRSASDAVTGTGAPWALVRLNPPTRTRLEQMLRTPPDGQPYHVLHFVGHGCEDGLWMENALGHEQIVTTKALVKALAGRGLHLAVLSACATEPVAHSLHEEAGVPAVVAMTEPVYETEAGVFDSHLYAALARGQRVGQAFDAAVEGLRRAYREGRLPIPLEGQDDPHAYIETRVALPVLVGDPAATLPLPPPEARTREPFITLNEPPQGLPYARLLPGFVGRGEELDRIARWMAGPDRPLFAVSGIGGIGKSALATMAALRNSFRFDAVVYASAETAPERPFLDHLIEKVDARLAPGRIVSQPTRAARLGAALDALKRRPTLLVLDNLETLDRRATADLANFLGRLDPRTGTLALCTLRPARKGSLTDLAGPCALPLERLDRPCGLRLLFEQLSERRLWPKVAPAEVRPTQREALAELARRAFLRSDAEVLPLIAALRELAEAAGDHPYLLRLAVGELHTTAGMTWPRLLRRLRTLEGRRWQERVTDMAGTMVAELAEREPEAAELLAQGGDLPRRRAGVGAILCPLRRGDRGGRPPVGDVRGSADAAGGGLALERRRGAIRPAPAGAAMRGAAAAPGAAGPPTEFIPSGAEGLMAGLAAATRGGVPGLRAGVRRRLRRAGGGVAQRTGRLRLRGRRGDAGRRGGARLHWVCTKLPKHPRLLG